jgi:hypothetical protein
MSPVWCEVCEQDITICGHRPLPMATQIGAPVKLPNQSTPAAEIFAAYLTVEARQARRRKIRWSCRLCPAQGFDAPGLVSFWAHWQAFHTPKSIWAGVR